MVGEPLHPTSTLRAADGTAAHLLVGAADEVLEDRTLRDDRVPRQAVDVVLERHPAALDKVLLEAAADLLVRQRAKDQHGELALDPRVQPVKVLEAALHRRDLAIVLA